jgi:hypothetical protein
MKEKTPERAGGFQVLSDKVWFNQNQASASVGGSL